MIIIIFRINLYIYIYYGSIHYIDDGDRQRTVSFIHI